MWRYHLASIFLLFCLNAVKSVSFRVAVEPKSPICFKEGENISLTCIVDISKTFFFNNTNWSLKWYHNEEQLGNNLNIHHSNDSITSRLTTRMHGVFTCVFSNGILPETLVNDSISIIHPQPVTDLLATPKFICGEDDFRYVVATWVKQGFKYSYKLTFKIDLSDGSSCHEETIEPSCNETTCKASMETWGCDISELYFNIETQDKSCKTTSKTWSYNLTLSSCYALPPKTLYYKPFPVRKLVIESEYRMVTLQWYDNLSYPPPAVTLTYSCSNTRKRIVKLKQPKIRLLHLYDKDIKGYAPYAKCLFCLSIQEYFCGQFSELLCETKRLIEEPPSEAPIITCNSISCPSTYDHSYRNLTVTWELPPEKSRGGILREIRIRYMITKENSTGKEIILKNLTSKSVVLKGLNKTLDYSIFLQVCNNQGCSGLSKQLQIYGVKEKVKYFRSNSNNSSISLEYIIGIVVGSIVVVIAAIILIIWILKKCKSSKELSKSGLERIQEPDENDYSNATNDSTYHELLPDDKSSDQV